MTDTTRPLRPAGAIPVLGFGTWQLRGQGAYDAVLHALRTGYRHVDTATMYGNEAQVGAAVKDSGVPRGEVFLTTKLPAERAGRARQTLDASLSALGVDRVDLWLIHWPPGGAAPEVWRELLAARDEGLATAVGVSNYSTQQVDELVHATGEAPAVNQIRWSPWQYDADLVAHHARTGTVVEGYSPFRASRLGDRTLREISEAHGRTPAQIVLRWHVETGVVVIPKSATPERIEENFRIDDFALTPDEVERISALGR